MGLKMCCQVLTLLPIYLTAQSKIKLQQSSSVVLVNRILSYREDVMVKMCCRVLTLLPTYPTARLPVIELEVPCSQPPHNLYCFLLITTLIF